MRYIVGLMKDMVKQIYHTMYMGHNNKHTNVSKYNEWLSNQNKKEVRTLF